MSTNGREALDRLSAERFDLILMDVAMPEMDGFEATATIRGSEATTGTRIPIIAMTAHALTGDRERCLAAGMDDYVSKPIQPSALFEAIERVLPGNAEERNVGLDQGEPARSSAAQAPAGDDGREGFAGRVTFDADALSHRLSGDQELMADVIFMFLEDLPARLAAIEIAVNGRDAEALRAAAHALKGVAGNLSALRLAEAARVLEGIGAQSHMESADAAWRQVSVEAGHVIDELRRSSDSADELHALASKMPTTVEVAG
jgi:CheY-like chemotaxis protein/HPt (histidine-containing phosphotransfer) domain-containing protein